MKTYKKLFVENPVDLVDVGNDTIKVRVDPIGHDNDKDFKDVPSGVFKKNTTVSQMVSKLGSGEGAASKFFKGKKVNPAIANEPVSKLPIEKNNIELRTTNDTVEEYGQPLKQSFKRYKPVFKETYLDFSDPQYLYLNPEDKDKELFNVNVGGEIEEPEEQNEEDVYNDEFEGNQAIADHEEIENFHRLGESFKFQKRF